MGYLKNGVLVNGPPPRNNRGVKSQPGPRVVSHRAQRTAVPSSVRRLDALMQNGPRLCFCRRLGGLGDILMATPIARGAKRKFSNAHVTFAVPTNYADGDLADLLRYNPFIDEVIDHELVNRDEYDAFADITTAGLSDERPDTNFPGRIELFSKYACIPLFGEYLPIYVMTEEEKEWGKNFVKRSLGGKEPRGKIAVHLRSNDPKRTWPAQRVREFLRRAGDKGYHCFLFDWVEDPAQWQFKNTTLVFKYKIRAAAAIMNECDLLVCPDSSLLHLGGALNMRIVGLFGSMPPACRIGHYPNAIAVVNQQISCIGCVYSTCTNNFYCMQSILPETVLTVVEQQLNKEIQTSEAKLEDKPPVKSAVKIKKKINTFVL